MSDDSNWYGQYAATFGDRVAAAREEAGMTQKDLARRLGVKLATVRGWEADRSEPRANRLSMLAGLLNVSMMWLINGEGEGIADPETVSDTPDTAFARSVLIELRELRVDMVARAEQLGRLEKRLRAVLGDTPHD